MPLWHCGHSGTPHTSTAKCLGDVEQLKTEARSSVLHYTCTCIYACVLGTMAFLMLLNATCCWENSSNIKKIFTLRKKIVRLMAGFKPRNSCRSLFKRLEILALPCECIFSLMNFIVTNQEHFQTNSTIHSVNTRNKHQLHRPISNLSCFQKIHIMLASKFATVYRLLSQVL
jgi:hypothetical protein